jgi:hypothetical protein
MSTTSSTPANPANPGTATGLFYIMSRIAQSDWVLSARQDNKELQITHADFRPEQLWTREAALDGKAFHLINASNNKAIKQSGHGAALTLVDFDRGDVSQKWITGSEPGDGWYGIASAMDTSQQINVAGDTWDKSSGIVLWEYSQNRVNEVFQAVSNFGKFTLEDIKYDLNQLVINNNLPPVNCVSVIIDTRKTGLPAKDTLQLQRQFSTSTKLTYSESTTRTLTITEKLGVKLILKDLIEVNGEGQITHSTANTITFGQEKATVETTTDTVTHGIDVPAGMHVKFWVLVRSGKINVPYTAVVRRTDGVSTRDTPVSGVYERVNATGYDIMQEDLVSKKVTVEGSVPFRAAAGA